MVNRKQDESDGRKHLVVPTQKGVALVAEAAPEVIESREIGWTGLSVAEYNDLVRALDNSTFMPKPS